MKKSKSTYKDLDYESLIRIYVSYFNELLYICGAISHCRKTQEKYKDTEDCYSGTEDVLRERVNVIYARLMRVGKVLGFSRPKRKDRYIEKLIRDNRRRKHYNNKLSYYFKKDRTFSPDYLEKCYQRYLRDVKKRRG